MKRVLITENDPLMAEIYRDSFEKEGFSAEIAPNGNVALQRMKGNPPDAVLLDLMMPNMNGVEVLKHIRAQELTRTLPVIVMSNAFATDLGQQAVAAGATKLLAKNAFGPRRIVKEIADLLASSPSSANENDLNGDAGKPLVELRKLFITSFPQRLAEIRDGLGAMGKGASTNPQQTLLDLHRSVHQLAGVASLAGFSAISQLACTLETLVKELQNKPERVNPASLFTAAQAVDVLNLLSERSTEHPDTGISSPLILVVDDEAISRETTCTALEQARLRALRVESPSIALKLVVENQFDLIFMDVNMPGVNGFDVCKIIHGSSCNTNTPVIFITSLKDDPTRVRFNSSGGVDFITKPIWLTELGVKALTHLLKPRPQPAAE